MRQSKKQQPTSHVASAVWSCTPDDDVAEIVFPRASNVRRTKGIRNVRMRAESLLKWYKGSLDHVLSIATNARTPGTVLEAFSKDTRLSVKRALLANPSTPAPAYAKLVSWALIHNDYEGLHNMSATMDMRAMCKSLSTYKEQYGAAASSSLYLDYEVLAERLLSHQDLVLPLASIGCPDLNTILAKHINEGAISSTSLLDLVRTHPEPEGAMRLVSIVLDGRVLLNTDLTQSWLYAQSVSRYFKRDAAILKPFSLVEDGCQKDLLVPDNPAMLSTAIVNGVAEDDLVRAMGNYGHEMSVVLESLAARSVSAECEEHIADRLIQVLSSAAKGSREDEMRTKAVCMFLANSRHELRESKVLALLRQGSLSATKRWLVSFPEKANSVKASIAAALLDDPAKSAHAFHVHGRIADMDTVYDTLRVDMLEACVHTPGLVEVLIKHYDEYLGGHLRERIVMRAVYPVLARNFGHSGAQNPHMRENWETFMVLAEGWQGAFSGLPAAVLDVLGHSQPAAYDAQSDQLQIW